LKKEHSMRYSYPLKTTSFEIFGHKAELRAFKEEKEADSYYFSVAFPDILNEADYNFILEDSNGSFVLENLPDINDEKTIDISWSIYCQCLNTEPLVNIHIKLRGTPVYTTCTFWRNHFPSIII